MEDLIAPAVEDPDIILQDTDALPVESIIHAITVWREGIRDEERKLRPDFNRMADRIHTAKTVHNDQGSEVCLRCRIRVYMHRTWHVRADRIPVAEIIPPGDDISRGIIAERHDRIQHRCRIWRRYEICGRLRENMNIVRHCKRGRTSVAGGCRKRNIIPCLSRPVGKTV